MPPFTINSDAIRAAADVADALEDHRRDMAVVHVGVEPDRVAPGRHEVLVEVEFTVESLDELTPGDSVDVTTEYGTVTEATLLESPDVNIPGDGPVSGYAEYQTVVTTENEQ